MASHSDVDSPPSDVDNSDKDQTWSFTPKKPSKTSKITRSMDFSKEGSLLDKFNKYIRILKQDHNKRTSQDKHYAKAFENESKKEIEEILKYHTEQYRNHKDLLIEKEKLKRQLKETEANVQSLLIEVQDKEEKIKSQDLKLNSALEDIKKLRNASIQQQETNFPSKKSDVDKLTRDDSQLEDDSNVYGYDSDSSADESKRQDTTLKHKFLKETKGKHKTSTPIRKSQQNEKPIKDQTLSELIEEHVKLIRQKKRNSRENAEVIKEEICNRFQDMKREITQLKEEIQSLLNQRTTEDVDNVQKLVSTAEQEMNQKDNQIQMLETKYHELTDAFDALKSEHDNCITDKQNYTQMLENISKSEANLLEKIEDLEKQIKTKNESIHAYRELASEWEEKYLELTNDTEEDQKIPSLLKELKHKIDKQTKLIEELTVQKFTIEQQPNEKQQTPAPTLQQQQPTYAQAIVQKTTISEAAIILRKLKTTKDTIAQIRYNLNQETKGIQDLPKVQCEQARDRDTLIIRTESDHATNKLLKIIEEAPSIKNKVQITYKENNNKKLIILGIPEFVEPKSIPKIIKEDLPQTAYVETQKVITREKALSYQLIIEVDTLSAATLLHRGRLVLGFNSCRIAPFRPILRCNSCQKYGHTRAQCRGREACQFCTKFHKSESCPVKEIPRKHRCINCMKTDFDFHHPANSSQCPIFKYHIEQRNTTSNNYIPPLI